MPISRPHYVAMTASDLTQQQLTRRESILPAYLSNTGYAGAASCYLDSGALRSTLRRGQPGISLEGSQPRVPVRQLRLLGIWIACSGPPSLAYWHRTADARTLSSALGHLPRHVIVPWLSWCMLSHGAPQRGRYWRFGLRSGRWRCCSRPTSQGTRRCGCWRTKLPATGPGTCRQAARYR